MEKKRRARINESLRELRTLLADADVSRTRTRTRITCLRRYEVRFVSDGAPLPGPTDPFQDGERRGAGDDSEKGGGHPEQPKPR